MDSPLPTEQPYSNGESAGMAVSYPSSIPCQPLAHRIRISRISSLVGSCCLRDALFDLGPGYVHHPQSMSCFTHETSALSLPIFRSGPSSLRCPSYGTAVHRTRPTSFALKPRYIFFPFSYATSFKPLARSPSSPGLSKGVCTVAPYAQLKGSSNKPVAYEGFGLRVGD